MQPKENEDLVNMSLCKALALTVFVITIGMLEKAIYTVQNFANKHLPH